MKKGIIITILGIIVVAGLAWFLGLKSTDPTASLEKELDGLQVEDLDKELQGIEAELQNL